MTLSDAAIDAGLRALSARGKSAGTWDPREDVRAVLEAAVPVLRVSGEDVDELDEAERAAALANLHVSTCHTIPRSACGLCVDEIGALRRHLAAAAPLVVKVARRERDLELAEQGRLLPEGCKREGQFLVRWYGSTLGEGAGSVDWGCDSLEHARQAAQDPPAGAWQGEVQSRERWSSPWSVVEQVEVSAGERQEAGE